VDAAIDQLRAWRARSASYSTAKALDLLAPEGVGGFGDRHAFAGAGIEDAHRPAAGRQCGEGSFERGFVGGEVPVLDEIAGEPREHEGHGISWLAG
jgi:hypothetical protein